MDDDQHAASTSVQHVGSFNTWSTHFEYNPLASSVTQATSLNIGINYCSLGPESRSI